MKSRLSILARVRLLEEVSSEAFRAWEVGQRGRVGRRSMDEVMRRWGRISPPRVERTTKPMMRSAFTRRGPGRRRGSLRLGRGEAVGDLGGARGLSRTGE